MTVTRESTAVHTSAGVDHHQLQNAKALPDSFTFIDLFAGIGGMRLGFEEVGGKCVFSSEIDKFARRTYAANFDDDPGGDITQTAAKNIPDHDVLVAGFPCQPFSIAGVSKLNSLGDKHGFENKTKGTLFFDVARILAYKRPKAFLLENVRNLVSHDKRRTFKVITNTLEDLGYDIDFKIIDGANVVPQHRERIYIVGFRRTTDFEFPVDFGGRRLSLVDILDPEPPSKYTLTKNLWKYLKEYKAKHRAKGNGFGFGMIDDPTDADVVTRTLSARYHKDGSEILINRGKWKRPRRLTPDECRALMGFPQGFKHIGVVSDTQAYRQFGNSVVVPIVRAIAKQMASARLTQPT